MKQSKSTNYFSSSDDYLNDTYYNYNSPTLNSINEYSGYYNNQQTPPPLSIGNNTSKKQLQFQQNSQQQQYNNSSSINNQHLSHSLQGQHNSQDDPNISMKRSKSTPFLNVLSSPTLTSSNNNNNNNNNNSTSNGNINSNSNKLLNKLQQLQQLQQMLNSDPVICRMENQIQMLINEVENLKSKLADMEDDDKGKHKWGLRYSRRVLIISNVLLGIWVSISRILMYIGKQKKSRLLNVVVPALSQNGKAEPRNHIALLLLEALSNAVRKSWIFFFSSFLISTSTPWRRQLGIFLCTTYSLYLAFIPQFLPWTNYFNVFASFLYITAAWSSTKSGSSFKELFSFL